MNPDQTSVDGEAWEVLSFLSGMGFWLILAVILIALVLYKKFRK